MDQADDPNAAQAEYWRSAAGLKWIELGPALDAGMASMLDLLIEAASPLPGEHVLDIGCGTGTSTLAVAKAIDPGAVLGLDISEPLLERARERAGAEGQSNAGFLLADAQTHAFAPGAFDLLISRFGMMFFADPAAAFTNLGRALGAGGRMVFVAWAEAARNPWFRIPAEAAIRRLGRLPPADPFAPGPLAFADAERVLGLLREAGLAGAEVRTVTVDLTPPGDAAAAAKMAMRLGPAARILREQGGSEADASAIEAEIAAALRPFEQGGAVRVPAVVHLFSARPGFGAGRV